MKIEIARQTAFNAFFYASLTAAVSGAIFRKTEKQLPAVFISPEKIARKENFARFVENHKAAATVAVWSGYELKLATAFEFIAIIEIC